MLSLNILFKKKKNLQQASALFSIFFFLFPPLHLFFAAAPPSSPLFLLPREEAFVKCVKGGERRTWQNKNSISECYRNTGTKGERWLGQTIKPREPPLPPPEDGSIFFKMSLFFATAAMLWAVIAEKYELSRRTNSRNFAITLFV